MTEPLVLSTLLFRNLWLYASAWGAAFGVLEIVFPLASPLDVFGAAMLLGYCTSGIWVVTRIYSQGQHTAADVKGTVLLLVTIALAAWHCGLTAIPGLADVQRMRRQIRMIDSLQSAEVSSRNIRRQLNEEDCERLLPLLRTATTFHPSHDWGRWSGTLVVRLDDGAELKFDARVIDDFPDDLILAYPTRSGFASLKVPGAAAVAAR